MCTRTRLQNVKLRCCLQLTLFVSTYFWVHEAAPQPRFNLAFAPSFFDSSEANSASPKGSPSYCHVPGGVKSAWKSFAALTVINFLTRFDWSRELGAHRSYEQLARRFQPREKRIAGAPRLDFGGGAIKIPIRSNRMAKECVQRPIRFRFQFVFAYQRAKQNKTFAG